MISFKAYAVAAVLVLGSSAYAETTKAEKVDEAVQDSKKNVKKGVRKVKNKLCMEGDLKCAQKKVENDLRNAGDIISDKVDDVKKKVD